MLLSDVKKNLGEFVLYSDVNMENTKYKLTACILRKNKNNEFVYSAELQDVNNNSILFCSLDKIKKFVVKEKKRYDL